MPPLTDDGFPITRYRIQRREALGSWRGVCRDVTDYVCEITNLPADAHQDVRIRASNSVGRGMWSEVITFNTLPRDGAMEECVDDMHTICMLQSRFAVILEWKTTDTEGHGNVRINSDAGAEFNAGPFEQQEIIRVELYDNCRASGHYTLRVLSVLDSRLEWTVTVTDTHSGRVKQYFSAPASLGGIYTDMDAFPTCSE